MQNMCIYYVDLNFIKVYLVNKFSQFSELEIHPIFFKHQDAEKKSGKSQCIDNNLNISSFLKTKVLSTAGCFRTFYCDLKHLSFYFLVYVNK